MDIKNKKVDSKDEAARLLLKSCNGDAQAAINALKAAAIAVTKKDGLRPMPDTPVVVRLQNVSKQYKLGRRRVDALKNVSLEVREGEFVALTGASGSGKSTLLQLIGGLDKPSEGNIIVDGQEIGRLWDAKLSDFRNKTIGFVFQFFYLQPFLTLRTNVEVPGMFARSKRHDRREQAEKLLEEVGLSERSRHLPRELSGGQMQRAAIARALLNGPKILLADEPTGNLDSKNSHAIIELFQKVRQTFGTTVIIVTHDPVVAAKADRELVLSDGELVV